MSQAALEGYDVFVMPDDALGIKFSDTVDIDQESQLLYMGDNWSGGIDIFDISGASPRYLQTVKMRGQFFGICVAKQVQKVYVGMTNATVCVIDIDPASPTVHTRIATIEANGRGHVDLIEFVAPHNKVYGALRNEGFVAVIDAKTDTLIATIDGLGGALEQPRYNAADGMVYLTGQAENVLYQIDPSTDLVLGTFDIVDNCAPNGMAINPTANQAILGCSDRERPHAVIWDLSTQKVASVTYETGRADGVIYSAKADRFFFAGAGYPTGPVMGVFGGDPVEFLGNVPTRRGASWVAFDETHDVVYAPTTEGGKPALLSFPLPEEMKEKKG